MIPETTCSLIQTNMLQQRKSFSFHGFHSLPHLVKLYIFYQFDKLLFYRSLKVRLSHVSCDFRWH